MVTLYFSGTGNSRYIAELFAAEMGGACLSIEETAEFSALIGKADAVAFVYPVYLSRVPRIMREFVKAHAADLKGKKLVVLCTQMRFSGDGARCFTRLLPRGTADVIYAEHIFMPNNCNNLFVLAQTGGEEAQRLFAQARRTIPRICADIKAGIVKKRGFNIFSHLIGSMQGVFQLPLERLTRKKIRISADCTGCGLCVKHCPMNNLTIEDGRARAGNNCTQCYRCLNLCPERAVNLFFRGKVPWQYHGVKVKQEDAPA